MLIITASNAEGNVGARYFKTWRSQRAFRLITLAVGNFLAADDGFAAVIFNFQAAHPFLAARGAKLKRGAGGLPVAVIVFAEMANQQIFSGNGIGKSPSQNKAQGEKF